MTQITKQDVEHVAKLARLKFHEEDERIATEKLGEILNYVDELQSAKTDEANPIAQIAGLENMARPDKVVNPVERDLLLQNAPEKENGFIKVKQVFE